MQIRKIYYNRNTPVISLPPEILDQVGAGRGAYFRIGVDMAKRIILTHVKGGGRTNEEGTHGKKK